MLRGLGMAQSHDAGGFSDVGQNTTNPFNEYGDFSLNHGNFTIISYNEGALSEEYWLRRAGWFRSFGI